VEQRNRSSIGVQGYRNGTRIQVYRNSTVLQCTRVVQECWGLAVIQGYRSSTGLHGVHEMYCNTVVVQGYRRTGFLQWYWVSTGVQV
jgi:hypothetical protein